ncbi:MAG: sacsin N-terminal ATP-binding-like domain-containing protein [Sandaracinaceae bacterium]
MHPDLAFSRLSYRAQRAQIEARVSSGQDLAELLALTAGLADPAPLAHAVETLAAEGAFGSRDLREALAEALAALPDPTLSHLLSLRGAAEPVMADAVCEAARTWPVSRASALALIARWLRRRAPARLAALADEASQVTDASAPSEDAGRWLFFVDGRRLSRLADRPAWSACVEHTVDAVVEALARAPKSVSQANAERLLARAVYADPGHFLFELLQNADDAGASAWSARFEGRDVIVDNDGAPLSVLDLVGLLSIGQTTKRADQIGFFGVGFKSVYEVCERPRVHSGPFDVEIAHVSIPRRVAAERPAGATRLVLPVRDDVDLDALVSRARAIPPETLLTLPNVARLTVTQSEMSRWEERGGDGEVELVANDGRRRRYASAEGALRWDGERAEGRSRTSAVKVFLSMDEAGHVVPARGPTLFAFLPTAERTGLSVKVHARFDVTLDRERLELGSAWNDALLGEAGRVLAAAVARLSREGRPALPALAPRSALDASVRPLFETLSTALREIPCVPLDGGWVTPLQARLTTPARAAALAGEDLGGGARAVASDAAEVLRDVGARDLDGETMVRFLEARLAPGATPPTWLPAVHDLLAEANVSTARLRALPLLATPDGLVRAEDATWAPAPWPALYAGVRPVVPAAQLNALPRRLRERLDVPALSPAVLVDDLQGPRLETLRARPQLLQGLAELSDTQRADLRGTALLVDDTGVHRAIDDGLHRLDPRLEGLRPTLRARLPLLPKETIRDHPRLETWVPLASFTTLAGLLESAPLDDMSGVAPALETHGRSLSAPLLRRFLSLPIFDDVHGERRPLVGPGRVWMTADAALQEATPEWPWLAPTIDVSSFALQPDGAPEVALALVQATLPLSAASRIVLLRWCASRVDMLTRSQSAALVEAPIWPDTHGTPFALAALRPGGGAPAIDAYYAETGSRHVAHPVTRRLLRALGHDDRLASSDHALFIEDQLAEPGVRTDAWIAALQEAARSLPPDELAPVLSAAVYFDMSGTARRMGSWGQDDLDACHRAGPYRAVLLASGRPLLAENEEAQFEDLFEVVGPPPASARDLVRHAGALAAHDPDGLLAHLLESRDALDQAAREALAALPLFKARDGTHAPISELADAAPFSRFEGRLETLAPLETWASEGTVANAAQLGLSVAHHADRLTQIVSQLQVGRPLSEQPAFARDPDDVRALGTLAEAAGIAIVGAPLAIDGAGRIAAAPLQHASPSSRALLGGTALLDALADPEWAAAVGEAWCGPVSIGRVTAALREAHAEETPPPDGWLGRLVDFVREHADALAADPDALASLGGAALWPSQRGPRKAARSLVLDATLPDVGLDWGLARAVPDDVAAWLADRFELDRRTRRTVVEHLLDGMDRAREADDRGRAHELIRVLASVLEAPGDDLEARCRRLKVRSRLQVPLRGGGWEKPRFAWAPADATADAVPVFAIEVPPQLDLRALDPASRALLAACGASSDLDDAAVDALLMGEGRRSGPRADIAFAAYLAARAFDEPARREGWSLASRAWLPTTGGELHEPGQVLAPTPLARAFFGDAHSAFPHPDVFAGLPLESALRLGCRDAAALALGDVASALVDQEARPALLDWLETGLVQGRLQAGAVRAALRDTLLLRDDEGTLRRPWALAESGARALFGDRRGDRTAAGHHPKLTRALGIPREPDAAMMLAFLEELGRDRPEPSNRLTAATETCLVELAKSDTARLPAGAGVACVRDGVVGWGRVGEPSLRMLAPAEAAELARFEGFADPLPAAGRPASVRRLLLASGVPDLLVGLRVVSLDLGPDRTDLDDTQRALTTELSPVLAGAAVRIVEGIVVVGTLEGMDGPVRLEREAVSFEGVLHLTPAAVDRPERLAEALALSQPKRRIAIERWLADRDLPVPSRGKKPRAASRPGRSGWLGRMKRWWGGEDDPDDAPAPVPPASTPPPRRRRDDKRFFALGDDVLRGQLDRTDGWMEDRREPPSLGFAFSPPRLEAPWVYAPKLVVTEFDARAQSWRPAPMPAPLPHGQAGMVALRGRLPAGEVVLPVPHYGRVLEVRLDRGDANARTDPAGRTRLTLDEATDVRLRIQLGHVPDLDRANAADHPSALRAFVPDRELPDEVLDRIADLRDEPSPLRRAIAVRDFIRRRYRYDPTYLEDASVGRWLARRTRGHAQQHLAALHAASDRDHLGAGVCYELNVLACAMMRAVGVPAAVATGWVYDGGSLSEPDHLWALALLEDHRGRPAWVPIDASTTREGRPLRVPRRPPGRFLPPKDREARAPAPTRWDLGRDGARTDTRRAKKKKRRVPRAELRRVLVHLERVSKRTLDAEERRRVEEALSDPAQAAALLERFRS